MRTETHPLQILASLVIDYFRWSQLTPMILMWCSVLGALFLLFFVNNQEATWTATERLVTWIASLPVVGTWFTDWMNSQAEDGVIKLNPSTDDLKSTALSAWVVLSLVFMVIGWIGAALFGPFKPWTLKRKLGLAALASTLIVAGFVGLYFTSPEMWNDSLSKVVFSGTGMALVVFVVSAWCLSVAHGLRLLSKVVAEADFSRPKSGNGLI